MFIQRLSSSDNMFPILIVRTINDRLNVKVLHLGTEYLVKAVSVDDRVCLEERAIGTIALFTDTLCHPVKKLFCYFRLLNCHTSIARFHDGKECANFIPLSLFLSSTAPILVLPNFVQVKILIPHFAFQPQSATFFQTQSYPAHKNNLHVKS